MLTHTHTGNAESRQTSRDKPHRCNISYPSQKKPDRLSGWSERGKGGATVRVCWWPNRKLQTFLRQRTTTTASPPADSAHGSSIESRHWPAWGETSITFQVCVTDSPSQTFPVWLFHTWIHGSMWKKPPVTFWLLLISVTRLHNKYLIFIYLLSQDHWDSSSNQQFSF